METDRHLIDVRTSAIFATGINVRFANSKGLECQNSLYCITYDQLLVCIL